MVLLIVGQPLRRTGILKMEIVKKNENGTLTLVVSGRLETATAPEFDTEIKAVPADVMSLRIDLGAVEYVSSAGLRVLLSAQKMMNSRHGEMELVGVNETVRHVLDITGFSSVLKIV